MCLFKKEKEKMLCVTHFLQMHRSFSTGKVYNLVKIGGENNYKPFMILTAFIHISKLCGKPNYNIERNNNAYMFIVFCRISDTD